MKFKKVLLVNLPEVDQYGFTPSPLGLLYLAAYLRKFNKKVSVEIIDGALRGQEEVQKGIKKIRPDLVGISVLTPSRHKAIEIAKYAKKNIPKVKIVLGGIHPTLMWEQMMENYPEIDYIVRGEGEITLSELVAGIRLRNISGLVWRNRSRKVTNNKDRMLIKNLDSLPFPAWELVDAQKYPPRGEGIVNGIDLSRETRFSIIFSRGCMGLCTFCSTWKVWRGYRFRKGKFVANEVEMMVKKLKAKHIAFLDDTLTGNKKEIISFCKEIIKRKINVAFQGCTRVDKVDEEILSWMKKAGFYYLSFGIESGSPRMLMKINKRTNIEEVKKAAWLTKKCGIQLGALIMFGLPEESEEDKKLTKELIEKIKPDDLGSVGTVLIFPGTALFEQAKRFKLMNENFWLGPEPYYVYRGGIGNDKFDWRKRLEDKKKSYKLNNIFNNLLFLKELFGEFRLLKEIVLARLN